jgi:hypothetical protein
MTEAKPCNTLMQPVLQLFKFSGTTLLDLKQYRMTFGALQYATITRPDEHWQTVKRILRYLKGTIDEGITIQKSQSSNLQAFTDADWARCLDDKKSTTNFAIFLGSNLISWSSKK